MRVTRHLLPTLALLAAAAACTDDTVTITQIEPREGSVAGGTRILIEGRNLSRATQVSIAGIECGSLAIESAERISCTTGSSNFIESVADVVVTTDAGAHATLPAGFAYRCLWTTTNGRHSCGAAPPGQVAPQVIASWVTEFQQGHGFVADPDGNGASNLADTSDFALGTQSAWIETDGAGTPRMLARRAMPAVDMRGHFIKVWIKVDNVDAASALELQLGDETLTNYFQFRLRSSQGQQWMTDGDWVAFTASWAPDGHAIVGTPDRAAIRGAAFRVVDDATGRRVRLHVNGIALVAEPMAVYPNGVLSFTFDDNHEDMTQFAAPLLAQHQFPATAYVIVDMVDGPKRASTAELRALQAAGWDIAAHAYTSINHDRRFPALPADVVESEVVDSRAWLMVNGFTGFDHCAYPGGDFTNGGNDVLPIAERYYTSCRTIYQRQREAYPPADPRKLRVFYVTQATTLESALAAVDHARANREWIIFVFHKLVDTTAALMTEWPRENFRVLVAHVAASGVPVKTVSDVLTDR